MIIEDMVVGLRLMMLMALSRVKMIWELDSLSPPGGVSCKGLPLCHPELALSS
jgi:hypothetical protein